MRLRFRNEINNVANNTSDFGVTRRIEPREPCEWGQFFASGPENLPDMKKGASHSNVYCFAGT